MRRLRSLAARIIPALAAFGAATAEPHAQPARPAAPGTDATQCLQRFQVAKQELISRGFRPTTDGDTERWLAVEGSEGEAEMSLVMGAADGPHTGYFLFVRKSKSRAADWRLRKRNLCCDDNHEASDHIVEVEWTKTSRGRTAEVALHRFRDALRDPQQRKYADLFTQVARRAAEDCLRTPAP